MSSVRRPLLAATVATLCLAAGTVPAGAAPAPAATGDHCTPHVRYRLADLGPYPGAIDVEQDTLRNTNFRTARWTAKDLQLTLMRIPVGGDVGLEMHTDVDQFLRIESGEAKVMMGTDKKLSYVKMAGPDSAIFVPSGTWHNIVNVGKKPLKLYSVYGPAQHPFGTVHRTQADDPGSHEVKPSPVIGRATPVLPFTTDPGAKPLVLDIKQTTEQNPNYRTAVWTADTLQLTVMSIKGKDDIGMEMHPKTDQFIRIEAGRGMVWFGKSKATARPYAMVEPGDAVLIPAGTWHDVVNLSPSAPLKLYSIYGPQAHPRGTVEPTKPAEGH